VHHSNLGWRLSESGQKPALPRRSIAVRFAPNKQTPTRRVRCDAKCRFCCKSLFALAIKNSFGRRRDFRVKMWGTSSPEDKLTGDLGNVIEATSIGGRRSDFFTSGKLAPGNLGLRAVQQKAALLDHLVSAGEQRGWHFQAKGLRSPEVEHQLVLGRRLHRQVGRLLALEDATDIAGRASVHVDRIGTVGDQAAGGGEVAERVDCRQSVPNGAVSPPTVPE
jgi:hypothetical protein